MSVLKGRRRTSKGEFVNTANELYTSVLNFLTRLSARYSRLLADQTIRLAAEVLNESEKANSIYPSDPQRTAMRRAHLLEAKASLRALDVQLSHCYDAMMLNPQGCFSKSNGESIEPTKAVERLDKMADNIGGLIDRENNLLIGQIDSISGRGKNQPK